MKKYLILSLILGSFFFQPFIPVSAVSENGGFVDVFERSAGSSFYEIKGFEVFRCNIIPDPFGKVWLDMITRKKD